MKLKKLLTETLKPSISKIIIFLLAVILASYFAKEETCGAFMFFTFCYKSYGFPFPYIVTGDISSEITLSHLKTSFLGGYFIKSGKFLANPLIFALDSVLFYLLSCIIIALFDYAKFKNKK